MNDDMLYDMGDSDISYIVTDDLGNKTRISDIPSVTKFVKKYNIVGLRYPITRAEARRIHNRFVKRKTHTYIMEVHGMAIRFQVQVNIVGLGPVDKHARWIDKRIKKMCAEIVKAKMLYETEEPDDILFARLEHKYGTKRFSKYRVGIERGSVRYDAKNSTWHATFKVSHKANCKYGRGIKL